MHTATYSDRVVASSGKLKSVVLRLRGKQGTAKYRALAQPNPPHAGLNTPFSVIPSNYPREGEASNEAAPLDLIGMRQ